MTTNTNTFAAIDLQHLDSVTGANGRFDYMMQQKQNPTKGGPFTCHINLGEAVSSGVGGAVGNAKGNWVERGLGFVGGMGSDLASQAINGCHFTHNKK